MRGGMAGVSVDDKENTQAAGNEKIEKDRSNKIGSVRRLSISGSKPRRHYLRVANRFQRKGGFGRGRITAYRPVLFYGSSNEFSLRSDNEGDRKKSFVVFENDVDSVSSNSRQLESITELQTTGKAFSVSGFKNATVEDCRTPKPQGTGEQIAPRVAVQQEWKHRYVEDFLAFRARKESMSSAKSRPRPVAPLMGSTNRQMSGARASLEILAARWHRGGRGSLLTQNSLDVSDLEDLEQIFWKIDEEDLEKEMHENNLEMEMRKYDLEDVMQRRIRREHQELFVSVKPSEAHGTVMLPVEDQAAVGELAPEPFNSQEWEVLIPRTDGLEIEEEEEAASVDLTTLTPSDPKEKLRLDLEGPFPEATPFIFELEVSPEATDTDRAVKRLTPPAINQPTSLASPSFTGWNNQDLETFQLTSAEVESEIVQTVEAFQAWSVELDPSRRRRETMQCYSNRHFSWIKSLVISTFQSAHQLPDNAADNLLRTPVTAMDSHERGLLSTNMSSCSGKDLKGREGDGKIRISSPDHVTTNEFHAHAPLTENDQDMQALKHSEATPSLRTSPTPPRNLSLLFGNVFGQMNSEELNRRWLQFCVTPVFQDAVAGKKKWWNVESTFSEPIHSDFTTYFPSEQVLPRTTEADMLPIAEEEVVSSDGLDRKKSTQDEDVLPIAEEVLSSDGFDGVMDYENDFDDISNDTTCIAQTGASSAENDQEGTSALKECPQEDSQDALYKEEMRCLNLPLPRDNNFAEAIAGPAMEYSLTHIDEELIDQFMNSLQVTPGVDELRVERPTYNGDGLSGDSTVYHNCHSPGDKVEHSNLNEELTTPEKDGNNPPSEAQDACTPVQRKPKTKRTRKNTKIKKIDSPLVDAGSKWSNGQRMSTRIRSKPLDWWRGERMLYGRVHSSLNTLIGIKHLSPDPVWPGPRNGKNKRGPPRFRVDSFVSDEHKELLRLAAQ